MSNIFNEINDKLDGEITGKTLSNTIDNNSYYDGIVLRNTTIANSNLADITIIKSYLSGTSITNVNLCDADLTSTDFYGARLNNVNLCDAILVNVNLCGAILTNVSLYGADLTGACIYEDDLEQYEEIPFTDAQLKSMNIIKKN